MSMLTGMPEEDADSMAGIQGEHLEETLFVADQWQFPIVSWVTSTRGCGTYQPFYARRSHQIQEPDLGDLEEFELLLWTRMQAKTAIGQGQAKILEVISMLLMGLR